MIARRQSEHSLVAEGHARNGTQPRYLERITNLAYSGNSLSTEAQIIQANNLPLHPLQGRFNSSHQPKQAPPSFETAAHQRIDVLL